MRDLKWCVLEDQASDNELGQRLRVSSVHDTELEAKAECADCPARFFVSLRAVIVLPRSLGTHQPTRYGLDTTTDFCACWMDSVPCHLCRRARMSGY